MAQNLGTKRICPKCQSRFYSMGRKKPTCPVCNKNDLIPEDTIVKVRLRIRPGGFNDVSQGWTEGYASRGKAGAVYLNSEYTVLDGPHSGKKVFSLIGLRSPKGPWWGNKGRTLIRGILNSAHNIAEKDFSPGALKLRRIDSFKDIDGLEFPARVKISKDQSGRFKNEIDEAIPIEEPDDGDASASPTPKNPTPSSEHNGAMPIWIR